MKILFVDNSTDLQQNWIDPLRKRGWGVVRARSAEDATRMMVLHGDGLEAIAVTEKFIPWAEKQEMPFVALITQWSENEVLKHQNSNHCAVSYLPFSRGCNELYSLFESKQDASSLKNTGTESLSLQDYSQILSKPETTRSTTGLHLVASEIVLGGGESALHEVSRQSAVPVKQEKPEVEGFNFENTRMIDASTVLLEGTQLDFERQKISAASTAHESESIPEMESLDDFIANIGHSVQEIPEIHEEPKSIPRPTLIPSPPRTETQYGSAARSIPVSNQFAIDPSPSSQLSDVGTLKSYLALREQDVAVLGGQVRSSQERIQQLEAMLKMEKARTAELSHIVTRQEGQLKNYDQEKQVEFEVLEKHIEDIDAQLRDRTDKVRSIEAKLRLTVDEVSKVKERVRVDIRRIRVREKELEGQLEILKKDSSALLQARDEKIIELKRKLDLLEFNMELVQEQYSKERKTSDELKSRLRDAASVMKQAGGLLEQ